MIEWNEKKRKNVLKSELKILNFWLIDWSLNEMKKMIKCAEKWNENIQRNLFNMYGTEAGIQ